ncbi:MAG: autotransporter-associated beta strand repeat-containing protein, partial [Puniceicoccales bacterium]|nr:autotransporter-associated beta strand repeat-containing protein [Puniceicoccales bacterium]
MLLIAALSVSPVAANAAITWNPAPGPDMNSPTPFSWSGDLVLINTAYGPTAKPGNTLSTVLEGSGNFDKRGQGTLWLSGVNTYTGMTLIRNGRLSLLDGGSIANSSVWISNGKLDISEATSAVTILGLDSSSTGGEVVLGSNTLIIAGGGTYSGKTSGDGLIQKTGPETLFFPEEYIEHTGGISVLEGTVRATRGLGDRLIPGGAPGIVFDPSTANAALFGPITIAQGAEMQIHTTGVVIHQTFLGPLNGGGVLDFHPTIPRFLSLRDFGNFTGTVKIDGPSSGNDKTELRLDPLSGLGHPSDSNFKGDVVLAPGTAIKFLPTIIYLKTGDIEVFNMELSGTVTKGAGYPVAVNAEHIGSGTLTVTGRIEVDSFYQSAGTLAGTGVIFNPSFKAGVKISPGANDGADVGTLNFVSAIGVSMMKMTFDLNLTPSGNDKISLTGGGVLVIPASSSNPSETLTTLNLISPSAGSYVIASSDREIDVWDLNNFTVKIDGNYLDTKKWKWDLLLSNNNRDLVLNLFDLLAVNGSLYWTGKSNLTWDVAATENWARTGQPLTPLKFMSGNLVWFGDTTYAATNARTITVLSGGVTVGSMTVESTGYIFNNGKITGTTAGTGPDDASADGALHITSAGQATFNDAIEFVELDIQGEATFNATVTSANPITVSGTSGKVKLGDTGRLGAGDNLSVILNDIGTELEFNLTNTDYTYKGAITGTGHVSKTGAAKLTLASLLNAYTGATRVEAGALEVSGLLGWNGTGADYAGDITVNSEIIFNQNRVQTLRGILSGTGNFKKNGTGTLTLAGNTPKAIGGTLTVNGGTLTVRDGSGGIGL